MPHLSGKEKSVPATTSPLFWRAVREILTEVLGISGSFLRKWYTVTDLRGLGLVTITDTGALANRRPRDSVGKQDDTFDETTGIASGSIDVTVIAAPVIEILENVRVMWLFSVGCFWSDVTVPIFKVFRRQEDTEETAVEVFSYKGEAVSGDPALYFTIDGSTERRMIPLLGGENVNPGRWIYSLRFQGTSGGAGVTEFGVKTAWVFVPTNQIVMGASS